MSPVSNHCMASSADDTFLSDIHIGTSGKLSERGTLVTRFIFCSRTNVVYSDVPSEDEDGDIQVARKSARFEKGVLNIEHAISTTLASVGLQVWRGALLASDYVLAHMESMHGATVLELGAGTGLVSLVVAMTAEKVYCTDTGREVLELCQRNVCRNSVEITGSLLVRELDWTKPLLNSPSDFDWTESDEKELFMTDCIIATDVIYSDELTDAFLSCLAQLYPKLSQRPSVLLFFEKRINFTLEDLASVAPAYDHFMSCVESWSYPTGSPGLAVSFIAEQLSTDFEQYFEYDRVKELARMFNVQQESRAVFKPLLTQHKKTPATS